MIARGLLLAATAASLSGCFFFYVPGSAVGEMSDALTGDVGNNCVAETAKVGDRVRTAGGGWATIKVISGKSTRCSSYPNTPVRALLEQDSVK